MFREGILYFLDVFHFLRPVSAVIVRRGNCYLIVEKNRRDFRWQFPQGGIENGESPLSCATRELREECGELLNVSFFPEPALRYRYFYPSHFVRSEFEKRLLGSSVYVFLADYHSGEVLFNKKELLSFRWATLEELKHFFEPAYFKLFWKLLP